MKKNNNIDDFKGFDENSRIVINDDESGYLILTIIITEPPLIIF